jgi:hypothetical protein
MDGSDVRIAAQCDDGGTRHARSTDGTSLAFGAANDREGTGIDGDVSVCAIGEDAPP